MTPARPRVPTPLEREEQAEIERLLKAYKFLVLPLNREYARHRADRVGMAGCADLIALRKDRPVTFVEVKRKQSRTKRLTALYQQAFADEVRRVGAVYIRVDERDTRTPCEQVRDALGFGA